MREGRRRGEWTLHAHAWSSPVLLVNSASLQLLLDPLRLLESTLHTMAKDMCARNGRQLGGRGGRSHWLQSLMQADALPKTTAAPVPACAAAAVAAAVSAAVSTQQYSTQQYSTAGHAELVVPLRTLQAEQEEDCRQQHSCNGGQVSGGAIPVHEIAMHAQAGIRIQ